MPVHHLMEVITDPRVCWPLLGREGESVTMEFVSDTRLAYLSTTSL